MVGGSLLKKDYFYWTIFFVLFILFFKILEYLWDGTQALSWISIFASRLIITIIGFVISILITEKINKVIKKK